MSHLIHKLVLAAGVMACSVAVAAEEHAAAPANSAPVNVEQKAQVCAACHGPNGVSTQPTFPTLAGQHKSYLEQALKAYKSGKRKNPVMAGQATGLSDTDIVALADYFSKQKGPLYTPALK